MTGEWPKDTIGNVCQVVNGGTPKTKVSEYWGGPHAWITPAEMGKLDSPYKNSTQRTLTDEGLAKCSASLLPPLSVILSSRAPIGHLVINQIPMATNQGCKGLVPRDVLDHKFLYYYLYSIVDLMNELGAGTTFKEISATKLKGISIPIPSLPEQKRIVAILDEAFAAIETATANAEKNLANAKELFESELNIAFSQKDNGWMEKMLGEIAQIKGGKRVPKGYKLQEDETEHPYITVSDFNEFGGVDMDGIRYISNQVFKQIKNYTITPDDVYISIAGTIGKSGIIPDELDGANLTENACRLIMVDGVDNKFIYYFTKTALFAEQAVKQTRIAAQPKLALSRLKAIKLNIPSRDIQLEVVQRCEGLSIVIQKFGAVSRQKLALLSELKQSILHSAFTCELLASQETVDTPGSGVG